MVQHVAEGEKIIKGNNIDDFGKLLHSAWLTKKKLSTHISSPKLDDMYDYVIQRGALGGKLLGAGGGGFFLFYMRSELKKSFLKKNKKLINVPFKFSNRGTEILFKDLKR
jgi:D-glycero-alpha-D-manno-heptose-7-phosphate kinase